MVLRRQLRVVDTGEQDSSGGDVSTTALRVAFATGDMKHVNQHFGSAKGFAIYAVDPEHANMLEAAEFGVLEQDGNEDKLVEKISVLDGCAAVYAQAVGSSAARKLLQQGIQPVKVSENSDIAQLIRELQAEMLAGPSTWLAKAIARQQGPDMGRFDAMEADGWDE